MLLRSSSTPVAQSLFSGAPHKDFFPTNNENSQSHHHCSLKELNFNFHLGSFSLDSSPFSHHKSPSGSSKFNPKSNPFGLKAIRKTQSDSNLEGLTSASFNLQDLNRSLHKPNKPMLRTEPSFSIYTEDGYGEENEKKYLDRSVTIEESIGSGDFSFGKKGMGLIDEDDNEKEEEEGLDGIKNLNIEEIVRPASPPMYVATGFGMDGNGVGGGFGGVDYMSCFNEDGDVEEYYRRMVGENPSNPLFLRNYAQLLQSKGDISGAEELYFRATLADPKDGEILLQYAKLVWELHHDPDRALSYFECAARAAPNDSHVLAAYASFLWEVDEDKSEDFVCTDHVKIEGEIPVELQTSPCEERPISPPLHLGEDVNVEEYYKRMVEENSSNPLFLRNYAQFLYQSKGDLKGAEEYYSRAILADPGDGEIISQYANLVWELYHDQDKALCYHERAVQGAPEDSHIQAAYARFLWEIDDGDKCRTPQDDIRVPVSQVSMTTANA